MFVLVEIKAIWTDPGALNMTQSFTKSLNQKIKREQTHTYHISTVNGVYQKWNDFFPSILYVSSLSSLYDNGVAKKLKLDFFRRVK